MGRLLFACLPLCRCRQSDNMEEDSSCRLQISPDSSSTPTSLSSQPSLPSVPSLTTPQSHPGSANRRCIATLKPPHSSYVFALALSGKFLYSAASNGHIRVWSRADPYATINRDNTVVAGHGAVKSMVVLGDKLFTAHHDHKIRVWKIDNDVVDAPDAGGSSCSKYKCVATLPTVGDRFWRLLSADNYVQVRRHKKRTWVHHVDAVSALALSEDASSLYSVSWDRSLKIWRTSDYKCLESVRNAHDDAINAVQLSSDGFVYTGSADKKIKVWRRKQDGDKKHFLVATLEKHKSAVNALALSADGTALYSGACDRSIVVWERVAGVASVDGCDGGHMAVAGALRGHTKAVLCLAVVSDLLCSGSADKTVRVWRSGVGGSGRSYSCVAVLEGHGGAVKCLEAAVDGGGARDSSETSYLVYSGSLDCDIKVCQISVPYEVNT